MTRPKHPGKPPLGVQVQVLLRMLGLKGKRIHWDHNPPLGLRPIDPETGDFDPPANDPDYLQVLVVEDHADKTRTEDMPRITKARRQAREVGQQARRDRRGGSSIPSRGFDKRLRKKFNGDVERRT